MGGAKTAGVGISDAKTGAQQFTTLRDAEVISLLQGYIKRHTNDRLFPIPYYIYLSQVKQAADNLGIPGPLTPHSARIGGALIDYSAGMDAEPIALHGRWESRKPLRYYLNNGRAFIQRMQIADDDRKKINDMAQNGYSIAARIAFVTAFHHQSASKTTT